MLKTYTIDAKLTGIGSFNANHCWARNVSDMSKNKFRCIN